MAKIQAHLTLIGSNFDLSAVSKALRSQPTWCRDKDELLKNGRPFGHCEWGVSTPQFTSDDITGAADALITLLSCETATMLLLAHSIGAQWHILFSIDAEDGIPVITISPAFSKYAYEIGAAIGFDIID